MSSCLLEHVYRSVKIDGCPLSPMGVLYPLFIEASKSMGVLYPLYPLNRWVSFILFYPLSLFIPFWSGCRSPWKRPASPPPRRRTQVFQARCRGAGNSRKPLGRRQPRGQRLRNSLHVVCSCPQGAAPCPGPIPACHRPAWVSQHLRGLYYFCSGSNTNSGNTTSHSSQRRRS